MNTRLEQFLSAENVTQSQFADTLGVARASISHLLAGRNKPSFDFIVSVARCYPDLNIEWLITGSGRMYKKEKNAAEQAPATLFEQEMDTPSKTIASNKRVQPIKGQKYISKVLVFYSDGTFEELSRE